MTSSALTAKTTGGMLITPLAGVFAGLILCWLVLNIPTFGQNLAATQLTLDYLHGWIWGLAMLLAILLVPLRERVVVAQLWVIKLAVVLLLMLPYDEQYGGADANGTYWFGVHSSFSYVSSAVRGANRPLIYIAVAVSKCTANSYFAMNLAFSLIGLAGAYYFYLAITNYVAKREFRLLYVVALTPTVLFWSSTLGKDPIVFFGCGLYSYGAVGWLRRPRVRYLAAIAIGVATASLIRVWYIPILAAPLVVVSAFRLRDIVHRIVSLAGSTALGIYGVVRFARSFSLNDTGSLVTRANTIINGFALGINNNSNQAAVHFTSLASMAAFWPWGAFTALFRPMIWDVHNVFMVAPALESTAILLLLGNALRNWRAVAPARDPVLAWAVLVVLFWSLFYGIGGYGNLGMAARERLEVMPFVALLALLVGTRRGRTLAVSVAHDGGREQS